MKGERVATSNLGVFVQSDELKKRTHQSLRASSPQRGRAVKQKSSCVYFAMDRVSNEIKKATKFWVDQGIDDQASADIVDLFQARLCRLQHRDTQKSVAGIKKNEATTYFPTPTECSIIGATAFHF